jgi:ABC-2 type transport system permease protein
MAGHSSSRRFRGLGDLKLAGRQIYYEQLNFWLNPIGAIFTVGFSVVFFVLVGSSAGHQHSGALGGGLLIQYYVPGFIAYGVMAACFNMLTINLVVRREMGLLKRVRLSPLPTWAMMAAIAVNALIISVIQVILVLMIGRFGYNVPFPHNLPALIVVLIVGVASLIPNQEAGAPVTSIVFFVLLFLSGLWFPLAANSGLAKFSSYLPVRHMILAVYDASIAQKGVSTWPWHDVLVMALWGAGAVLVAARRWSWAPRQAHRGHGRNRSGLNVMSRRQPG